MTRLHYLLTLLLSSGLHGKTTFSERGLGVISGGFWNRPRVEHSQVAVGVLTWGNKDFGGDSSEVAGRLSSNVTTIFSNSFAGAALKIHGEVVTWGWADCGGDSSEVADKLSSNVSTIFSTESAFAALKTHGEVVTWGEAKYGGDSSEVAGKLSSNVATIFSNDKAFAALKIHGEVVTWGSEYHGGDSSEVAGKLSSKVSTIFSNDYAFAALKIHGEVVTWGDARCGGNSSEVADKLSRNVTTIFSNDYAFAALKIHGEVVTWGWADYGGDSSQVADKLSSNVTTIFASASAFAALKTHGEVVTWGDAVGDFSKVAGKLSSNVTTIFSNQLSFAALKTHGEVVTWGWAASGGDSSNVAGKLSSNVATIFSNRHAFAALKTHGEVVTWGDAEYGGDSSEVAGKLSSNVTTIVINGYAFAALKTHGEVVTWGNKGDGGDSSEVAGQLSSNVATIFSNNYAFAALKTHGEVVAWGSAHYGGDLPMAGKLSRKLRRSRRVQTILGTSGGFAALVCIPDARPELQSACEACAPNMIWKDMRCQECDAFRVPDDKQSKCISCGAGFVVDPSRSTCSACPGNTFSNAGDWECLPCPEGLITSNSKQSCSSCPLGTIIKEGISTSGMVCKPCPLMSQPNQLRNECSINTNALAYVCLLAVLVALLVSHSTKSFTVIDVSFRCGSLILTTLSPHSLHCPSFRPSFPITLHGTCHPCLDAEGSCAPRVGRARPIGSNQLELLDANAKSIDARFDTSKGTLSLTCLDSCFHMSWPFVGIPWVIPLLMIFVTSLCLAFFTLEASEICTLTLATLLMTSALWTYLRHRALRKKTPLQKLLDQFRTWLLTINPRPIPCAKGPGRAIRLDKLLATHDFFRPVVLDRNAYYLDSNILKSLTAEHKLSYAETVGPELADFFVSHYWGTAFDHFCQSLVKHAENLQIPICNVSYWICFCSNNQYDIKNELGGDVGWQESSFYLALQSPSIKSVCMVLDESALPLTRSWCIFETLQALLLSKTRANFELLMCTATGVMNHGTGSIEAAMGLAHAVAKLDLEEAQASCQSDKDMIDSLVLKEMGSYDQMNDFVREDIEQILLQAQDRCAREFVELFNEIRHAREKRGAPAEDSKHFQQQTPVEADLEDEALPTLQSISQRLLSIFQSPWQVTTNLQTPLLP